MLLILHGTVSDLTILHFCHLFLMSELETKEGGRERRRNGWRFAAGVWSGWSGLWGGSTQHSKAILHTVIPHNSITK